MTDFIRRSLRQPAGATQTESQKEENATETPKSPEQSENVIENKGPAAQKRADEGARPGGDAGAAPNNPVLFRTGPDAVLNSLALKLDGIDKN